jgi:hypothetical protein
MRPIYKYIALIYVAIFTIGCEEVIDLELNDGTPRLVIEASVNVLENGTSQAFVLLSKTFPYFDQQVPFVDNAEVMITSENGEVLDFIYETDGRYFATFTPETNTNYTLEVVYEGEVYSGTTQLIPVASFTGEVEQNNEAGFGGNDIEVKAFYPDPADEENYYFFIGKSTYEFQYSVLSDEFFNGNEMFVSYRSDELKPGDVVRFELYGIDKTAYNFLFILLSQVDGGFGPFSTQPATVRGNITNQTQPENFPLGYFRMSEVSVLEYTVQ